jgi:polyisoprenoid-binding protein YceI
MSATETTTSPTTLPAGTYRLDPVHSSASFAVKHMVVATFRGRFENFDATLTVGEDGNAHLSGVVQAGSIEVKDENLKAHLQAPDFFDAERHPEVSFSGREVGEGRFEGQLTIKGITQPATLEGTITGPVTDPYGNERYGLALTTIVDRTAFGLNWNAPLPGGGFALANDVTLKADLSLVKAA